MENYNFKEDFLKHKATYILSMLITVGWLSQFIRFGGSATSWSALVSSGGLFGSDILFSPDQIWRLLSALFVHIGWIHWLMNVATLFFMGRVAEEAFGTARFTAVYLLSGIFGNALSFFVNPAMLSAGASTSIFGIFAALAALGYFSRSSVFKEVAKTFAVIIVINLIINLTQMSSVNIWAHVGGMIGGLILAPIFAPLLLKKEISSQFRFIAMIVFVVLLLLFIILPFFRI